ncbi:MAG: right-handed parallel beta-helix repeat-containing protein [Deltaproteobacteria bacterium]|nr:right-handed parallel beta-helix repeat-containing protein [Deltaproteobacteria bacterium]
MVGAECREGEVCSSLELISLSTTDNEIWPGRVNIDVTAALRNRSSHKIEHAAIKLTFIDSSGARDVDFVARQNVPWSGSIKAGHRVEIPFTVDVSPLASIEREIIVNGELLFIDGGVSYVLNATKPIRLYFAAINSDLTVNTTIDSDDGSNNTEGTDSLSLRKALRIANERPGIDRITFSQDIFITGQRNLITLDSNLPDLPPLHGDIEPTLLIADNNRVTITPDSGYDNSRRVGISVYGPAVVSGIEFLEMSRLIESSAQCPDEGPEPGVGSAILIAGGENAAITNNNFDDTGLLVRPCIHHLIAVTAGENHVLANNFFNSPAGSVIGIFSSPVEVRGNRIINGLNNGVVIDAPGNIVKFTGNLLVNMSAVGLGIFDNNDVEATHNTFVRTQCNSIIALAPARLWLRNNVYIDSEYTALSSHNNGLNINAAYEATDIAVYCQNCLEATIDSSSMIISVDAGLANSLGSSWEELMPTVNSVLIDSGLDVIDRNGSEVGRFSGYASDRGAIERP